MDTFILAKDKLKDFLSSLEGYETWAPVSSGTTAFLKKIDDFADATLDLQHQVPVSKSAVFPQTELLFTFERGTQPQTAHLESTKDKVVFGLRPCDARSFTLLDPVFEGEFPDPYYLTKRNKTVLIGLACNEPFANCFCTSIGGNPFSHEGLDLLFTECSDSFYIEAVSEKGRTLVASVPSLFVPATKDAHAQKEELAKNADAKIKRLIDLTPLPDKLLALFDHPIWDTLASQCISCGICTYSCPTCYCFDMQDEATWKRGKRIRTWDSCMFPEYTAHASGHNPRPTRSERLKNRLYHKFKFNVDNYHTFSCVGCGRCISLCPVNVDLIDNLSRIKDIA